VSFEHLLRVSDVTVVLNVHLVAVGRRGVVDLRDEVDLVDCPGRPQAAGRGRPARLELFVRPESSSSAATIDVIVTPAVLC